MKQKNIINPYEVENFRFELSISIIDSFIIMPTTLALCLVYLFSFVLELIFNTTIISLGGYIIMLFILLFIYFLNEGLKHMKIRFKNIYNKSSLGIIDTFPTNIMENNKLKCSINKFVAYCYNTNFLNDYGIDGWRRYENKIYDKYCNPISAKKLAMTFQNIKTKGILRIDE